MITLFGLGVTRMDLLDIIPCPEEILESQKTTQ